MSDKCPGAASIRTREDAPIAPSSHPYEWDLMIMLFKVSLSYYSVLVRSSLIQKAYDILLYSIFSLEKYFCNQLNTYRDNIIGIQGQK